MTLIRVTLTPAVGDHDDPLGAMGIGGARLMADSSYGDESDNPFAGAHDSDEVCVQGVGFRC